VVGTTRQKVPHEYTDCDGHIWDVEPRTSSSLSSVTKMDNGGPADGRGGERDDGEPARSKVGFQMQLGGKRQASRPTGAVHGLGFERQESKVCASASVCSSVGAVGEHSLSLSVLGHRRVDADTVPCSMSTSLMRVVHSHAVVVMHASDTLISVRC
jgi:hypothetical protein